MDVFWSRLCLTWLYHCSIELTLAAGTMRNSRSSRTDELGLQHHDLETESQVRYPQANDKVYDMICTSSRIALTLAVDLGSI